MPLDETKASSITSRYDELMSSLSDPAVVSDQDRYLKLSKELAEITPKAEAVKRYFNAKEEVSEALELLKDGDEDIKALANEQLASGKKALEESEKELLTMLQEKDPRDDRSVIMEIRAGAGGEEAALCAATLYKMYQGYAARHGFSISVVDYNDTELGGYKEIVFEVNGQGAYSRLKFESGVHRIQRVPVTESGGRIHTSTATVAVLPEADATDVVINPEDLKIDRYRSSGAGGQHINKTSSAIRITHLPTGIVVQCQDERSQFANKDKAMAVLQSRLWAMAKSGDKDAEDQTRREQVGTGDRSERIRTYNYHDGRVTDHRIGLTLYKLDGILGGDLDEIVDALTVDLAAKKEQEQE
ncbi:MAG: peptide chain release factor 1 [Clostridiales bacterium]|nr:peptide chain release factor 1 [Clostridiales bacterium]